MRTRLLQHLQKKTTWFKSIVALTCLLLTSASAFAQTKTVTGTVTDAANEPLIGASVLVQGTSTGTITDMDGKYSISVTPDDVLAFSYVGMTSQSVKVGAQTVINVTLKEDSQVLAETVVIGYGSAKKRDLTGSITNIKGEELANKPAMNPLSSLQGKVAGVQIVNSGRAGSDPEIRIRGTNSINGYKPLYIVDGLFNDNINFLNPEDIESMEILKDAAAAAIYGAKGANGVVIITTKRGAASTKPKFSFSLTGGLDMNPNIPLEVLSPEEYAKKMLDYGTYDSPNLINFWQNVIDNKGWNDPSVHNWMDEITRTARKYEANASISGGTKGTTYMLSLGYLNNTGIIKRSAFDRFTSRLNLNQEVNSKINIGINLSYSTSKDKNPVSDWSQSGVILNALQISPFLFYPGLADIMNYSNVNIMSPLVAVDQVNINNQYSELNGNIYFNYKILKDLTFSTSASYRQYSMDQDKLWGSDTWYGQSERGRMEISNREENSWVYEARLQYAKSIKKHSFSLMGAFEASKWSMKDIYNKSTNFEDMAVGIWGIDKGLVTYAPKYTYDSNQMVSYISRGTYTFDNKYVLNASLRVDGSSKFGANNKYGYFPAVSVAWRASEEEFIKKFDFISNLRVRTSFGMTGNNQIPSYQSLSQLENNKVVMNGSTVEIGRYPSNVTNDDLKWESQKQYNIGFDFGVLDNRFSITADFYYKRIDDMLLQVNIPSTSGYTKAWKNAGSMENKGMEFAINANWFKGAFNWSTDFNISFY